MATQDPPAGTQNTGSDVEDSTYTWIMAWIIVIALGALALQTATGYRMVYYGLVLILVFLFVTQYKFISTGLAPIGTPAPTGS